MSTLWPRLPDVVTVELYERVSGRATAELIGECGVSHPGQTFAATGGTRADASRVNGLRQEIVAVAEAHGFPDRFPDSKESVAFDRDLAPRLFRTMDLAVAEAADRRVWNFIALVVAPDVTAWRFPGSGNRERWVCRDRRRHMFSRLWWHAYLFADPATGSVDRALLDRLNESELNQLLERTSLSGNRRLLLCLARHIASSAGTGRRDLVRDVTKRVLRRMAFVDYHAVTDDELETAISQLVDDARRAVGATPH